MVDGWVPARPSHYNFPVNIKAASKPRCDDHSPSLNHSKITVQAIPVRGDTNRGA